MTAIYVFVGGGLGALARFGVGRWLNQPNATLPWGTLAVNVLGAALLGVLAGVWAGQHPMKTALGTGVLGGFTTFSAFSLEAVSLPPRNAAVYVFVSVVAGLTAAYLGFRLVR